MERLYARVMGPYMSTVAFDDDVRHLLQDMWHLKDWLKNDPGTSKMCDYEGEVARSTSLRILADLANGSKHLARNHNRVHADVVSTNITVHVGQNRPADIDYVVELGSGERLSIQDVIRSAHDDWVSILKGVGLL